MDYARAIKAINKDAEFIINDSDLDNINWLNDTTPISKSDIQTKMTELLDGDKTEKTNITTTKIETPIVYSFLSLILFNSKYTPAVRDKNNPTLGR